MTTTNITLTGVNTTIALPANNSVIEFSGSFKTLPVITIPITAAGTQLFLVNLASSAISILDQSSRKSNINIASNSSVALFSDGTSYFSVNATFTGTTSTGTTTPPVVKTLTPASYPQLRGVNMAGGDLGYNQLPPVSGSNYLFPNSQDIAYILGQGANFIRLIFCWEAIQPTLNATINFTSAYFAQMDALVKQITAADGYVLLEMHQEGPNGVYLGYMGSAVGTTGCPNTAYANFLGQLAGYYKNNPYVCLGTGNEPNSVGTSALFASFQAGITAIRAAGFTGLIFAGGNGWQAAVSWTDTYYDTASPAVSNAAAALTLKDPQNNMIFQLHSYFDSNESGEGTDIQNNQIAVTNLTSAVAWARTNKLMLFVGEFGCSATNSIAAATCTNMLNYVNANLDVIAGTSWWTSGSSWYNDYQFTLNPSNNYTTASPQLALAKPFFTNK
jgi:endoglucanase